jgi:Cu-processing system permease protein
MRTMVICARQELTLALRSRWTQVFAAVFAVLSLSVASSGYILSGGRGVQDFARTAASLVELVLLLVPLTSIVIGVLSLAPERGSVEMLYAQPVARSTVLFGRMLGLLAALLAAQAIGFGGAGLMIFARAGGDGARGFFLLVVGAAALTAVFLGLAALIATGDLGRRRARALAVALVVWFAATIVFDLVALSAASFLRSGHASRLLITAALVNPVDAFRTGALLGIEGTAAFGAASLALLRFTHGAAGAAALIAMSAACWIAIPALVAARRLKRMDF